MRKARLAVLGRPVQHSRSPDIHAQFARQTGIELDYGKILVPEGDFDRIASAFLEDGLGFNVTVPCKHEAFDFVDETTGPAEAAQAVNTVFRKNGTVFGANTDGPGLVTDITRNLEWVLAGTSILILGAGGAVSGVLGSLLDENPAEIHLYNRTREKATRLAERFADRRLKAVDKKDLAAGYPVVINGTSAGLAGESMDLPPHIVGDGSHCYDMIYGAGATIFNRWCLEQAACTTADGLGMLVEQAALSFGIWFDRAVDTEAVIASLRAELG